MVALAVDVEDGAALLLGAGGEAGAGALGEVVLQLGYVGGGRGVDGVGGEEGRGRQEEERTGSGGGEVKGHCGRDRVTGGWKVEGRINDGDVVLVLTRRSTTTKK